MIKPTPPPPCYIPWVAWHSSHLSLRAQYIEDFPQLPLSSLQKIATGKNCKRPPQSLLAFSIPCPQHLWSPESNLPSFYDLPKHERKTCLVPKLIPILFGPLLPPDILLLQNKINLLLKLLDSYCIIWKVCQLLRLLFQFTISNAKFGSTPPF